MHCHDSEQSSHPEQRMLQPASVSFYSITLSVALFVLLVWSVWLPHGSMNQLITWLSCMAWSVKANLFGFVWVMLRWLKLWRFALFWTQLQIWSFCSFSDKDLSQRLKRQGNKTFRLHRKRNCYLQLSWRQLSAPAAQGPLCTPMRSFSISSGRWRIVKRDTRSSRSTAMLQTS